MENKDDKVSMLLRYCAEYPETYNEVARILSRIFEGPISAELNLICTYVVSEILGGRSQ